MSLDPLADVSSDALSTELRLRTELHRQAGSFSLLITEEEAEELWYGRVPTRVREMAKAGLDWFWEDLLAANAAKPIRATTKKEKVTRRDKQADSADDPPQPPIGETSTGST